MWGREVTTDKIFQFMSVLNKSKGEEIKLVEQATSYNKVGWS